MTPAFRMLNAEIVICAVVGFAPVNGRGANDPSVGDALSRLRPPSQEITRGELFARLVEHNQIREHRLAGISALRTYQVAEASACWFSRTSIAFR